ncbi:DUF503 domain-containing protein [Parageobacillus thermoglucosidasius]|jgi:uncharacterized protein YlxP (DUF503 family)|uniref:DUF503 domain-containing protein n=3 Tax=Anoxybacillaceae TaxID=3120669 RepID=A0AAN0YNY3_PARTM|nr:DUF503 family protein [Parageobacillus thermoglucosidasius]KYD14757.1 hypothetical protein B4168_1966 [Anoxybacillus flavithermus]REK55083.1 MAG: DUF503 domain-containing protein [Geobacillus sp.]AEH48544.1 protein of unknown function DUF503 [Parageobacillus thermoglucosidasius C56-YS93]ALF10193.1 hypothetical protein AOT13_09305 [Parageobacillus thermoglucosidasius]ANZ30276.1 hypothetical protein BCV53_09315 [Parageobacillus thermoglucosidasius]
MIGFVACECLIYDAQSLKEKRAVLQRIITRLKQKYNISVAEIDHQNVWQRTTLGIVAITASRAATEQELQRALALIDSFPELERTVTTFEWF